ncbi:alpha/beta hydrolase-fold protein [Aequorivita sp. Q41]|uniref:alpha/beta hydrolase-fold protein n=1 Tax=Aequorivita sp. Q41 TaxID=3153300 RepID=UPI00324226C3
MKKQIPLLLLFICAFSYAQQFKTSYSSADFEGPFSGKVFLYLSKENKRPKDGFVGITSFPCYSIDVENIMPGATVVFDDTAKSYPVKLSDIERGNYYAQVVWDRNLGGRAINESPGNIYNPAIEVTITQNREEIFTLKCSETIAERLFIETEFIKELKAPSTLLSKFHTKEITVNAAVILPKEYYTQADRHFPVLFKVAGYGGDYLRLSNNTSIQSQPIDTIACITVYLDGNCALGHSVYTNSANNGPWGDALVKEFIPALEKKFRTNGAKLLTGHSSGGWTVLSLQTRYPEVFDGCWSSAPDPVDFRDYQGVNLYKGENLFYTPEGTLRNVATVAGRFPWASSKQMYAMENIIYRGEQMHSFNAVFSAKGSDGTPERLCDPVTGAMNPQTFEHWKNYDISLYLRNNWDSLKRNLDSKIRVSIGSQDNFLLTGAVYKLEEAMKALNANMEFEYFPGDHFTIFTPEYQTKGNAFLANRYKAWEAVNKK